MKRKILITASTFGHIENFHLPYLKALQESGCCVHVFCGGRPSALPYTDRCESIPLKKDMLSTDNFRAAARLHRLICEEKYELIIMHTSLAAFFTRLALWGIKDRPKTVNVVHGYLFDDRTDFLKAVILKLAERITAGVTDVVLTMNRYDFQWAVKNHAGREVKLIPGMGFVPGRLGSSTDRGSLGFDDSDFILVFPAEFSRRKNQSFLIKAMPELPEQVKLVLLGRGELEEECKALADRLGVSDRLSFPGYERDIGKWLGIADVAVSSSRIEGLPFNIMEAMACGLPVVASRVKGNEDIVFNEQTGLLYEYDNAEEYRNAVLRLFSSVQLRREMGRAAKMRVEDYCIDKVFTRIMEEYLNNLRE